MSGTSGIRVPFENINNTVFSATNLQETKKKKKKDFPSKKMLNVNRFVLSSIDPRRFSVFFYIFFIYTFADLFKSPFRFGFHLAARNSFLNPIKRAALIIGISRG